jgi:hypothetical protein
LVPYGRNIVGMTQRISDGDALYGALTFTVSALCWDPRFVNQIERDHPLSFREVMESGNCFANT